MDYLSHNTPLYYIDEGPNNGLPLLFIHGMGLSLSMWNPQINFFNRDYRTIAVDLRGHGQSRADHIQITYRQFADDLNALLDHLEIPKAVLCGLSMGGAIALRFQELYPQKVSALVICNSRSEADSNELKYWREGAIKELQDRGIEPFVDTFLKQIVSAKTLEQNKEAVTTLRHIIQGNNPVHLARIFLAQMARPSMTDRLDNCKKPALIIGGEHDTLTPPEKMRPMHEKLLNSTFHIIPEVGHMSNLENHAAFNSLLDDFFKTLSS